MFTGIVRGMAQVVEITSLQDFQTHKLKLMPELLENLQIGASIAHNGCCLTVTKIEQDEVSFDLMQATLKLTNLGLLKPNDYVNVERAAKVGDDIGGHSMSGHIMGMGQVTQVIETQNNRTIWMSVPERWMKYVLKKGYIGVDGCSLTIGDVQENTFCVHLIPETLTRTLMGARVVGDWVNIEIDPQTQAIVDTVERVLTQRLETHKS